ncbi:MAG: chromosome segregation protein SMC, partial [Lachnospiraceae bacterium]|nr:chromosome segregation protein SMC [Lachnospiraceae bacterium]
EKELKEACDKVISQSDLVKSQEEKIRSLTETIGEQKNVYERRQERVIQKTSHMETLRDLVEHYDGYGNAVRKVMEQKKQKPGVIGVVADVIEVDPSYETAIETALGGNIQNILTDTEETAKQMIEYLKTNRLGRATFIPLSEIRAKKDEFTDGILREKGVLGIASDLVKTDDRYREAVRYLLGRFLVVDTIDHAIAIEKKNQYSLRIVTQEGELFQPGGAISGGSFRNNSNLLGKRREAEELEQTLASEKELLKEAETALAKLRKEREEARETYEENRKVLQEYYVQQNTAKLNLNHIKEQNGDILGKHGELTKEIAAADEAAAEAKKSIDELNGKIRVNTEASEAKKKRAEEIHAEMESTRLKEDDASAEAMRVLSEYSGLQQNIAYQKDNAGRIAGELKELGEEKESLSERAEEVRQEIARKEQDVLRIETEQTELGDALTELEGLISKKNASAEEITKQNKGFFERRESLSENLSRLDKELFRLQNQQEKMAEQIDYQTKYMWDEYELTYSEAEKLRDPAIDNPTLNRKAVYEMKNKIRALGDVNVNAIEDYRETKERYDFLTAQRDDIINAEQSLSEIITTLDAEMRKQFTDTFAKVQERFDKVFRELFGGGKGTLKLEENVDVLEADISVIAQPPGKKLQNMMQLSGGEKALTAISLLFAILDLKPSPFCLLDEIEAALDDGNVTRFAKYLHKLTKDTQFIVITHRRGTMAAADALYGITMQEKGVSTLVSVNLIENQLDQ